MARSMLQLSVPQTWQQTSQHRPAQCQWQRCGRSRRRRWCMTRCPKGHSPALCRARCADTAPLLRARRHGGRRSLFGYRVQAPLVSAQGQQNSTRRLLSRSTPARPSTRQQPKAAVAMTGRTPAAGWSQQPQVLCLQASMLDSASVHSTHTHAASTKPADSQTNTSHGGCLQALLQRCALRWLRWRQARRPRAPAADAAMHQHPAPATLPPPARPPPAAAAPTSRSRCPGRLQVFCSCLLFTGNCHRLPISAKTLDDKVLGPPRLFRLCIGYQLVT